LQAFIHAPRGDDDFFNISAAICRSILRKGGHCGNGEAED
jgi:hypothetical protein